MTMRPGGDAGRSSDIDRVSREMRDRLEALGIRLDGHESADELVRLEDAVEQFEVAVESRGAPL